MRPARILLLLVAIVAGGLAAFLATRGSGPAPRIVQQIAAPAAPSKTQVLVAKQPIGVGQRLAAASVEWQPWPANAVRPEYITIEKTPDAPATISGAVARFEIFEGEPILDAKLVHTDQGYLSAVLEPGMRGVSINIAAASGSGGFIIPNDRVDVVVTESDQGQTNSRVILNDVKVLAIGTRLGQSGKTGAPADATDPKSQVFTSEAIATLELTPPQADTLINASSSGKISLVLRSVADFGTSQASNTAGATPTDNQSVKIIRFGRELNITPGSTVQSQATVNPVAFIPPTPAAIAAPTITAAPAAAAPPAAAPQPITVNVAPSPATAPTVQPALPPLQ